MTIEGVNKEIDKMITEANQYMNNARKGNHWDGVITNQAIIRTLTELKSRINKSTSGIWTIIKRDGWDGPSYHKRIQHIIQDSDGNTKRLNIMDSVSDDLLNLKEPQLSDDEPGYEESWSEFEEFKADYLVGKKININSFRPEGGTKEFLSAVIIDYKDK